jgi:hypothetical protein
VPAVTDAVSVQVPAARNDTTPVALTLQVDVVDDVDFGVPLPTNPKVGVNEPLTVADAGTFVIEIVRVAFPIESCCGAPTAARWLGPAVIAATSVHGPTPVNETRPDPFTVQVVGVVLETDLTPSPVVVNVGVKLLPYTAPAGMLLIEIEDGAFATTKEALWGPAAKKLAVALTEAAMTQPDVVAPVIVTWPAAVTEHPALVEPSANVTVPSLFVVTYGRALKDASP